MKISAALVIAIQHHQAGRLPAAEQIYRQILAAEPNHADALHLLGVIAYQSGRNEIAVQYIRRAIGLNGRQPTYHANLGCALKDLRKLDEAIACHRRALELKPDSPETHNNLGNALQAQGKLDEAVACWRRALELKPDYAEAHNNLGNALKDQGELDEALACYRQALERNSHYAEAHNNLGIVLKEQGNFDEAIACYRRALELQPDYAEAHNNLGVAFKDQGRLDEALACCRRALEAKPEFVEAQSNLLYAQLFHPDRDAAALCEEHRRWNQQYAAPLVKFIQPHRNDRSPDRRLRIGYVSPDFREHCQALFTVPLLSAQDHEGFEIVCYADVVRPDGITGRLRSCADGWRNIVGLGHEQVAELIRQDGIDILVDLSMHMAGNRLLVFARKPAPVQACWLAYPGTTGVSTIDYRITDPYLDPPGLYDHCYTEQSVRLPDSFWCYDPLADAPAVNTLPVAEKGHISFGCLNNFCKVNPSVLKLWAEVLKAVAGSRLTLLAGQGTHRQHTLDMLAEEGVDRDRVTFVTYQPRGSYLANYRDIDIGLDTVPYNGHTTSLDSYWMGVPVVTLVGPTVVGRAGLSQLTNLGLPELIAAGPEQFVRIAAELAHDFPRLSGLRATLRERLRASPLMDAPRFARNLEAAYRAMWRATFGVR